MRGIVTVLIAIAVLGLLSSFTPALAEWSSLGSGTSDKVESLAVTPSGALYAGGLFSKAGGDTANRIARWNGSSWTALGTGINSSMGGGTVRALVVAPDGTLYVGGSFTTAGGIPVRNIARWNGSGWSALGAGMNGAVNALAVADDGTLYAGGTFTTAGSSAAQYVARWNGSTWSALGSNIASSSVSAPQVNALAVASDGSLYVAGRFNTAGGHTAGNVAKWDGTSWNTMSWGVNGTVNALALTQDDILYVGGSFSTAGGSGAKNVARWKGSSWSALGQGTNSAVNALAVSPDGTMYAGGLFTTAGGVTARYVAVWDGIGWSALDTGIDSSASGSMIAALATTGGELYAGGEFATVGGVSFKNVALWTPTVPGAPTGVSAKEGNALAKVYFTPPRSNGGSRITRYTVTSTPDKITARGTASPITIKNLTNGTTYSFKVTATNVAGTGPPSESSNLVTPAGPTGSLIVTISPDAAAAAGAQWNVDNGSWTASGTKLSDLSTGVHHVGFLDGITGWYKPGDITVNIQKGKTANITGEYADKPTVADFTVNPSSGAAPLRVAFTDASTGYPKRWLWKFGDGKTSTKQSPAHTYKKRGTYTVTLTVTAANGATSTKTASLTVYLRPKAVFTAKPTAGKAPLTVRFANKSKGDVTDWLWDFGDSETSTLATPPAHLYSTAGKYTVTLKAIGPVGESTKSLKITVRN